MTTTQKVPETIMQPAATPTTPRKLFVNIPVDDLRKSMDFFGALGFQYNPQFADETAACMLVGEDAYVMLLTKAKFASFTPRPIHDPRGAAAAAYALTADSRAAVDELLEKAIAAGGSEVGAAEDHGFMYQRSFLDLDGHHWEFFWMDPSAMQ